MRKLAVLSVLLAGLALATGSAVHAGGGPAPGDLLGSTGALGSSLIDVDPATGAGTLIGALGSMGPVTEIEFRDDGVLFGTTGGGSSNVITIDPATGAETLVGQHAFGAVNGLEFAGGVLYGGFFSPGGANGEGFPLSSLVTVDQATGALTLVGALDYSPVRGLAYDTATDTMYGIGLPLAPNGATNDVLFTVDLGTGATVEVGDTGFVLGSLEFGPDGNLYAGQVQASGTGPESFGTQAEPPGGGPEGFDANLVLIDPATGAGTAVGPTGFPGISGLTFVPGGGPVGGGASALAVPTLSQVGVGALVVLLSLAGVMALRRR